MESVLIAIAALVSMLLLLVVVHEAGHFFTARGLGVKVLEFGVGFPPRAFGVYTGRTQVLIDHETRFVNLNSADDLRRGRFVKVVSAEDSQGNLVARVVEAPANQSLADRLPGRGGGSTEQPVQDDWLKHEGKIRSVGDGSFALADMLYSMNWIPLGGFVRLAGESNPSVPRSLASKGVGTRFLVLVAGPLMNAILPIVFFTILLMLPQDVTVGDVVVESVSPGSPAQAGGLEPRDVIVKAGRHDIENRVDLARAINLNGGSVMEWLVVRGGIERILRLQPRFGQLEGRWLTGIQINSTSGQVRVTNVFPNSPAQAAGIQQGDVILEANGRKIEVISDLIGVINLNKDARMEWVINRAGNEQVIQVAAQFSQSEVKQWLTGETTKLANYRTESRSEPPWVALGQSFVSTWELLVLVKEGISGPLSQGTGPQLSGPIGIAQIAGEVTRQEGFSGWIAITILLSINLAILNILPIPMLDGGRLVFVVLEWVRRGKRVPPEREGLVHLIGFAFLIGVILLISANDITRLIQGKSLLGG
ncbi:MAG: RIP metalloprotease RseP [Chloroflexi bacterium]|nr:RIP metalloprotease RseP [Chloroflexota bacterium]